MMMIKKIVLLAIILMSVIFASCKKEAEEVEIRYYVNDIHPGTQNANGKTIKWKVNYYLDGEHVVEMLPDNVSSWSKSVLAKPGDISYMYLEFNEDIENNAQFSAGIQFDRQLFKEARNWFHSQGDTLYSIKLAGTIPFLD